MIKIRAFHLVFFTYFFCSCNGQSSKEETCAQKFKTARTLAYENPYRISAIDSALILTNEISQCKDIRKAVVDFKITLLLSLQRYQQTLNFIDSLSTNDFIYDYKKNTTYKGVLALRYDLQGDKVSRDSVYKEIGNEVEKYIENRHPSEEEFNAIYTDLFATQKMYLNPEQIDNNLELLKRRYPAKSTFFDFFKSKKSE